ncbi:3-hydroxy-fatty acyl-ACP dehydratase, partial [Enterobacter hormaechei]
LMQDERFGSFECAISANEETLATGRVNTFQPSAEELTSLFNQGSNA